MERRYLTLSIFISVLMIGFGMFGSGWVKKSFMPDIESDEIIINVVMPEGAPYSRALEVLAQMQDAEKRLEEEVNQSTGGQGVLIENWYTRSRRDSVIAIVKLAPPEVRQLSAKEAAVRLRELMGDVPDAKKYRYATPAATTAPASNCPFATRTWRYCGPPPPTWKSSCAVTRACTMYTTTWKAPRKKSASSSNPVPPSWD